MMAFDTWRFNVYDAKSQWKFFFPFYIASVAHLDRCQLDFDTSKVLKSLHCISIYLRIYKSKQKCINKTTASKVGNV